MSSPFYTRLLLAIAKKGAQVQQSGTFLARGVGAPVYAGLKNSVPSFLARGVGDALWEMTVQEMDFLGIGVGAPSFELIKNSQAPFLAIGEGAAAWDGETGAGGLVTFSAHRYWRFNFLTSGTNSYQLAEIELRDTIGGSDLTGGGTASASNAVNGAAADAVDDNATTIWRTNTVILPVWWQYDFGVGNDVAIAEILFKAGATNPGTRTPTSWDVQYSDDGSAWTNAWGCRSNTAWASGEERIFRRPTVSYRINVSANDGATNAHQIAELEFLLASVDQSTGGTPFASAGNADPAAMFDEDNGTMFIATSHPAPYNARYDFTQNPPFDLEAVSIVVGAANLTRAPNTFTIERSDDGGYNWDVLDTVSGETGWGVNEKRTFTI